jgi:hypothetical protein
MHRFSFLDFVAISLGMLAVDLASYNGTDAELIAKSHGTFGALFGVWFMTRPDAWFNQRSKGE